MGGFWANAAPASAPAQGAAGPAPAPSPAPQQSAQQGPVTLQIGDKKVQVGAAFLSMTPEQQAEEADQIGQQIGATAPDTAGGIARQAAIGTHSMIDTILGAPVDAMRADINTVTNPSGWQTSLPVIGPILSVTGAAAHALGIPQIPDNTVLSSNWLGQQGANVGIADPNSPALAPKTPAERLARAGGEGAASMILPEAALGTLAKAGIVGPEAEALLSRLLGKSSTTADIAKNAAVGAASGVGAQAGQDAAPDQFKPLAGMVGGLVGGAAGVAPLAAAGAVKGAAGAVGNWARPFSAGGRAANVGDALVAASSDPTAAIAATGDRLAAPFIPASASGPASPTTLGAASGDKGLLSLQRAMAAQHPDIFAKVSQDQAIAQGSVLEGLAPTGSPEQAAQGVTQHIANLDQQAQAINQAASAAAQSKATAAGVGQSSDVTGASMQAAASKALDAVNVQKRGLYDAIDPQGTLALSPTNTTAKALETVQSIPASAAPLDAAEKGIYGVAASYGDTVPFSELRALQQRTTDAMATEYNSNGKTAAYGRLSQFNGAIHADLEKAVAGKIADDKIAVASGQMVPEDSTATRLEAWVNDNRSAQEVKLGLAADSRQNLGFLPNGSGAAGRVRNVGTASSAGVGLSRASGDPRLSGAGLEPNFDQAALDRLRTANAFNAKAKQTFEDNATVGPIIERNRGASGPFSMPPSSVPGSVFKPGPKSVDAIRAYRNAVGPEVADPLLEEHIVDRARHAALNQDGSGTFDPKKLAAFRHSHSDALALFPKLDAALANAGTASSKMAEVAASQKARIDNAQKGVVGRLMGLHSPQDVTRTIASIFGKQDSVRQMTELHMALKSNPDAAMRANGVMGLQKAVIDHMVDQLVSNTEAGTSGRGIIKGDVLQNFIAREKGTLRGAGFSEDHIKLMENVADDYALNNRPITATKLPGGSNTAQDTYGIKSANSSKSLLGKTTARVAGPAMLGIALHLAGGGLVAGIGSAIAAGFVNEMRNAGINSEKALMAKALADPVLGRALMVKAMPKTVRANTMLLRHLIARSALSTAAQQR